MWEVLDIGIMPLELKIYIGILAVIIGLVFGSFLNCVAIRLINEESIIMGRSHCPSCNHTLGTLDLIPILSWIFLNGRCRYCQSKISPKYPISELVSAILVLGVIFKIGLGLILVKWLVFIWILFTISLVDFEAYIIPDSLIILGILNRIVFAFTSSNIKTELMSSLIGGLIMAVPITLIVLLFEKIMNKEAMGGGDLKLFFMVGIYFSWSVNLFILIVSCLLGILFGVIQLRISKFNSDAKIFPFGPAISLGSFIGLMCGKELVNIYLSFIYV